MREVLERDFLLKLDGAQRPNWWTMVTAAFSHQRLNHLLGNLSGFEIFSEALISMGMTPVHYLGLIFGSAIFANVSFWRLRKASSRRRISPAYALGLSGVVVSTTNMNVNTLSLYFMAGSLRQLVVGANN